jgi:hypothetical protein
MEDKMAGTKNWKIHLKGKELERTRRVKSKVKQSHYTPWRRFEGEKI